MNNNNNNNDDIYLISAGVAEWLETNTRHAQFIYGGATTSWGSGYELRDYTTDEGTYSVYVIIDNREIVNHVFSSIDAAYRYVYAALRPLAAERRADTIAALVAETMTQTRASDDVPEVGYFAATSDPEIFAVGNVAGNPRDLLGGVEIRGTFYNFGGYWEHGHDDWGRVVYSFRLAKEPAPAVAVFPFGLVDEWDLIEKCSGMGYAGERDEVAAFEWFVDNAPADTVGVLCFLDGVLCYVSHDDYAAVTCGECGATYGECGHDDAPTAQVSEVLPWVDGGTAWWWNHDDITHNELAREIDTLRDEVEKLRAELNDPRVMRVSVDEQPAPGSLSLSDVEPTYRANPEPRTVREVIDMHVRDLRHALNELDHAISNPTTPAYLFGDLAGDIRGEACGLWQLLIALKGGAQ